MSRMIRSDKELHELLSDEMKKTDRAFKSFKDLIKEKFKRY